jgi:hypothetical protein
MNLDFGICGEDFAVTNLKKKITFSNYLKLKK